MRHAGAIDIGATRTKIGIVAEDGRIVQRTTIPTSTRGAPEPLVESIATAFRPLVAAAGNGAIHGVGVSVAGFLDREHSTMTANANLPLLCGFPLRRELERRLDHECRLEVDSNAAVLAEYRHGMGRGATRLLGVTVGTGLGGGVIVDGQLLRYTGECAGDVGHIILDPEGRQCTCGARGCFEAMVCSASVIERAGRGSVPEVIREARAGERRSLDALAETGRWLGIGLASLAPLFAPDTIVVGGGVAASGQLLLDAARDAYRAHAGEDFRERVRITGSTLEGWDGMIGAASIVFQPMS
jgi:glucokinase